METFIRKAKSSDIKTIINLLHDDFLGKTREENITTKNFSCYQQAFNELSNSSYFDIFIMLIESEIVGCYQIMYLPHLSFKGMKRAQVESLRIKSIFRGKGLGHKLLKHAIDQAKKLVVVFFN